MKTTFKLIEHGTREWKEAVRLREEVLRKPLGSVFSESELEEEKNHYQIAGYRGDALIATAVLVPEINKMKMQRVVVVENYRGLNIGSEMMLFCEAFARNMNVNVLYCHARDSAVNFYLRNNYKALGNYFDEDGIPHLKMEKFVARAVHS